MMAPRMMTPPIVGVPFFVRWRSGVSSRIVSPPCCTRAAADHPRPDEQRDDERRDQRHERAERQVAEDVEEDVISGQRDEEVVEHRRRSFLGPARGGAPPARRRPAPCACRASPSRARRRPAPAPSGGGPPCPRRSCAWRGLGQAGRARRLHGQPRVPAHADHRRRRAAATGRPISRWASSAIAPSSSMSPSTTTRRPPPRPAGRDRLERRPHRDGVRVVGVVEDAARRPRARHTQRPFTGRASARPRAISASGQPERHARGRGGEGIRHVVASGESDPTGCALPPLSRVNARPSALLDDVPARPHVGAGAPPYVTTRARRVARHARDARVVGVQHGHAVGREGADERRLLLAHAVERAEELGVGGGDRRDDADGGRGERGQRRDLAGLVGADLDAPSPRARAPSRKSVSGSPHWLLKLPSGFSTVPARAEDGRRSAPSWSSCRSSRSPPRRGMENRARWQAGQRARAHASCPRRAPGARWPARRRGARARPGRRRRGRPPRRGTRGRRGGGPWIAKKASPTPSARESIDTPVTGTREITGDQGALGRADDVLHGERRHWALIRGLPAGSRAPPPRSSNGQDVGADDLVGLVALPGDDHRVAGRRPGEGAADGRAPVGSVAQRLAAPPARRTPATISSMIASGRSERGLSEVTHTRSHRRAAIAPMIGRLPRSRSPPQPNTTPEPAGASACARWPARARARPACARSRRPPGTAGRPAPARSGPARCRPPPSARGDRAAARGPARARSPRRPAGSSRCARRSAASASAATARRRDRHADPVEGGACSTARTRAPAPSPKRQHRAAASPRPSPRPQDRPRSRPRCARASASRASSSNSRRLARRYCLERAVEVEVVLGEVGEHRHVEGEPVGAREGERVRGHFHRDAPHAAVAHARASIAWRSSASGVVWLAGRARRRPRTGWCR